MGCGESVLVMWRWVRKVDRISLSSLSTVGRCSCVVRGAWKPAEVTSVLRRKASVLVCVGASKRRCVLVVMLL